MTKPVTKRTTKPLSTPMTKQEFLRQLERLLHRVPIEERREMLYDYEEHIRSAIENGSTESEAVAALGNPRSIAKELLATAYVQQAETKTSIRSVSRAVLAVIGLGFFNLVVVLGPFIGIIGLLIGLYAASFSLVAAPIAAGIRMLVGPLTFGVFSPMLVGFGLLMMEGIGIVMMAGVIALTKVFGVLCVRYLKLNLRIIEGGK